MSVVRGPLDAASADGQAIVWMDGTICAADDARISVLDRGVVVGAAAFETMTVVRGEGFALRRHLARLRRTCGVLGIPLDRSDPELRSAVAAALEAAGPAGGRLRMTVTSGTPDGLPPSLIVTVTARTDHPSTSTCITVPWRRNERGAAAGLKTTSYAENVIALGRARELGADEPVFANTAGNLCEGASSNVFVVLGGVLVTPPLGSGCLAGVTRELLMEALEDGHPLGPVSEIDLPVEVLARADEIFLTSSTRGVSPVEEMDGRRLPVPGPFTVAAQQAWAQIEAGPVDP